jgi:hypothetical protein
VGTFLGGVLAVGVHTSWTLWSYLCRPRTVDVPFLREREGSFADSLRRSSRSALGIYDARAPQGARGSENEEASE